MSDFYKKVYEYVKTIPAGYVVTYGQVACAIGSPKASRQVGRALHNNPAFGTIPCHRVVFADGSLAPSFAFGGSDMQAALLRRDGVEVTQGKVNLLKYQWHRI